MTQEIEQIKTLDEALGYIAELQETESSLSAEVLREGKQRRHWEVVAEMRLDALDDANAHIKLLEANIEDARAAAWRLAREHYEQRGLAVEPDGDGDVSLPKLDPSGIDRCTVWFKSRADALDYAKNNGFFQRPEKRRVWLDLAFRDEWSLRVATGAEKP
jgi:hypothetical protein